MKLLTCIICPNGCRITAALKGEDYMFSGNKCPRGTEFARTELTSPMRSVTTTVRTAFSETPVLPVRTKGEIPKALIPALIRALAGLTITSRVSIGEIIAENVLGTGVDIIATSDVLMSSMEREYYHASSARSDHRFGNAKRQGDPDR
jgi:CxxC motif-containing protein